MPSVSEVVVEREMRDSAGTPYGTGHPETRHFLRGDRRDRVVALCEGTIDIVAALFNVSSKEIRAQGRGEIGIARVRQIAMYAAHVTLGLSMKEVGLGFGRDRTTVLHAVHLIEDLRDDGEFDHMVQTTERLLKAVFQQ